MGATQLRPQDPLGAVPDDQKQRHPLVTVRSLPIKIGSSAAMDLPPVEHPTEKNEGQSLSKVQILFSSAPIIEEKNVPFELPHLFVERDYYNASVFKRRGATGARFVGWTTLKRLERAFRKLCFGHRYYRRYSTFYSAVSFLLHNNSNVPLVLPKGMYILYETTRTRDAQMVVSLGISENDFGRFDLIMEQSYRIGADNPISPAAVILLRMIMTEAGMYRAKLKGIQRILYSFGQTQ